MERREKRKKGKFLFKVPALYNNMANATPTPILLEELIAITQTNQDILIIGFLAIILLLVANLVFNLT